MTLTKLENQLANLRQIITRGRYSPDNASKVATSGRPSLTADQYGNVIVGIPARRPELERVIEGYSLAEVGERIFRLLYQLAIENLEHRGQSFSASQTVFHAPNELIYTHLGISKATYYRQVHKLSKLGLLAHTSHYSRWYGLTRSTGTLYAISLKAGHHANLRREDKVHKWRDLQADTEKNQTAWALLRQSKTKKHGPVALEDLKAWVRCPGHVSDPLSDSLTTSDSGKLRDLVYLLPEIEHQKGQQRDQLVTRLAQACAAGFLDQTNYKFWCSLLYRAADAGHLNSLKHALTRLITDLSEWPGLKSPGALLIARLKLAGIWDDLQI